MSTTSGTPSPARSVTATDASEPIDREVGGMHLEDAAGVLAHRGDVVVAHRPVGGAHLANARTGRGDEVGQTESVADLDHLATAPDNVAALGQCCHGQDQGGRSIVDHEHVARVRQRGAQSGQRAASTGRARPGGKVELHVDVAGGGHQRIARRGRERRAAEVGVENHAGGVEHGVQRRRVRREVAEDILKQRIWVDGATAHALLAGPHHGAHQWAAEADQRFAQLGAVENDVRRGDGTTRVREHLLQPSRGGGGGRESNPPGRDTRPL